MGAVDSGNAPGLNSRPSACGRSARSRREVAFGGIARRSCAAQGQPPQTRLGPWLPRSPGPLGHPPGHPRWWFSLGAFLALFFWPTGGSLRPRAKTVIFGAQGGTRGVWGLKGAVQGPPMDPSDGSIAGLVERDT